ncbi:MAG TPA: hypothetical protein DEO54_05300 [Rikenellaceae bacterium]|nr:MAG: hypothetical protein A2X20_01130 [Bacteroidetes bacterium GWE2_40_15]HBZ25642.1 hypothetical protein [Rikenellaceae bacterium]
MKDRRTLKNIEIPIYEYKNHLKFKVLEMIRTVYKNYKSTQLDSALLMNALKNRPVVFCGGGAMYDEMRPFVLEQSNNVLIDKTLLNIHSVRNTFIDEKLYTILATSYGLSIPMENEIELTPIEDVFLHLKECKPQKRELDYEHGLTDY